MISLSFQKSYIKSFIIPIIIPRLYPLAIHCVWQWARVRVCVNMNQMGLQLDHLAWPCLELVNWCYNNQSICVTSPFSHIFTAAEIIPKPPPHIHSLFSPYSWLENLHLYAIITHLATYIHARITNLIQVLFLSLSWCRDCQCIVTTHTRTYAPRKPVFARFCVMHKDTPI